MSKQVQVWIRKVAALLVLCVVFGGGEALCADCHDHAVAAEHAGDGGADSENTPHPCTCTCHVPVGWIEVSSVDVSVLPAVSDVATLMLMAASAPGADIDLPPQLA